MLALGGDDRNVKIFDKRESKIVQTFDDIHQGNILDLLNKLLLTSNRSFIEPIYCVRWSQNDGMLASASGDGTAAVLDSKTGKKLFTGNTSDKGKFSLFTQ